MRNVFMAEFQRSYLQFRRYWLEGISELVIVTVMFILLLQGAKFLAGPLAGDSSRVDVIIVAFAAWTVALGLIGSIAHGLQEDVRTGTLEQLFLSTHNATLLFIIRGLVSVLFTLSLSILTLFLLLLITQRNLHFSFQVIIPFLILVMGSLGISLTMGALTLLVKQTSNFLALFQFALLFLVMIPIETFTGVLRYTLAGIPLLPSVGLLRQILTGSSMEYPLLFVALIHSGLLLMLGMWLFRSAEKRAKQQGLLFGH
jgi:ABC-2 type transport system permease protein